MVLLWGEQGIMLYNDAYSVFAGARHPKLLGSAVREGWAEIADFNDTVMRVGLSGGTLAYRDQELTLERHGRPEPVFMNLDYSPVLDESDRPAGVLAIVIETTERVLAERRQGAAEVALRAERDRAQGVLDNMGEAFVFLDSDFRIVDMNAEAMRLESRPREEIIGRTHFEAHPNAAPELGALYQRVMKERIAGSLEHHYLWPDGRDTWIEMRAYPIDDGLAVFYRDVTAARHEADDRVTQAAERGAILAQLTEGVIVTDADGAITFVNEAAERLHGTKQLGVAPEGYAAAYSLWTEEGDPYPPLDLPLARAALCGATVLDASWRIRRADGTEVLARGAARPITMSDGRRLGAVLTFRDETERHSAELMLRDETRALATLNRAGAALAAELDIERLVQMVSEAGVELTGAQFGAYFHNVMDETGERLHLYTLAGAARADFESMGRPRATAIFGPTFRNEGVIRSDDILADPRYGKNAPHRGMPTGHLPVRSYLAVSVVSRSGGVLGGLLFGHPEPGRFTERHEGLIQGLAGQASVAIDNARLIQQVQEANETLEQRVHERTDELEHAQEALRQAQKMEAVGQLTGGIAHDFNNLLTGIIGSLDMMQRQMAKGDNSKIERYATTAMTSANRAAALTHRLLAFSRRQPIDPKPVNANRLVTGMEELLRRTIGEAIALEVVTAGGLWQTLCDPHQLESAILNLAINARDAMPHGGSLTIETCNAHLDNAYTARQRDVRPGQYVCICVTDTGSGMSADTIAKAFEPFFTTKPIGQGTGLGLSMIYGFARQSEGYAKIYSEIGQGTTVKLYLPRYYGEAEGADEEHGELTDAHRADAGEVVLVVEDETAVRDLVVDVLEELGYRAIQAADGPAGLKLLQSKMRIDLLVTDIGLPGLNGRQVADAARLQRPDLKVLFMTGYAENATIANGFLDPGMEMITKPFAIEALATRVRDMIEN
ncbi:PAS domain-containing protein [Sphingomonas sp. PAMC 26617]|uniref:PAS domain-containing protein n=1 Tax=Sphingomonas sp. PAMC 26617 TaxID=1112216 RepID=UPI000289E51C